MISVTVQPMTAKTAAAGQAAGYGMGSALVGNTQGAGPG